MTPTTENWFFVRGLVRESGHWGDFPKEFAKRFPHRQVHLLDLKGSGIHFREESASTVPEFARALREDFLASTKGKENAKNFVVSVSLGAMVTLEWLHEFPNDLQGAVLINTSLRGISPFFERLRPQNYFTILKLFLSGDPLAIEKKILAITSNHAKDPEKVIADWAQIQRSRPVSKQNALRQIRAAARFHPPIEKPKASLLILNSAKDKLVSPRCSERLAKYWNNEIRIHPTAGHDLTLDAPEWTLDQLATWPKKES